jgi:histidine triad (HIT) family protein
MTEPTSCIFCAIINKKITARIEKESANVLAFHDTNPVAPVHILIVPKVHVNNIYQMSNEDSSLLGEIILTANFVAKANKLDQTGYRLVINTGEDAGQTVHHVHCHVIGGRSLAWPPG